MKQRRRKNLLFVIGLGLLLLSACKDELDLTAEYRDTMVVYCLLNPEDSVHYVRIHRAFLTNGNVLESAQVADSSVYNPAHISVVLYALENPPKAIPFTYVADAVTGPGIFHPSGIMLYRSTEPITAGRYRLQINHSALNKEVTAEADILSGFSWKEPKGAKVSFIGPNTFTLEWFRTNPDWIYQPEIILRWTEVNLQTGESVPDSAIWDFNYRSTQELPSGGTLKMDLPYPGFFTFVAREVAEKPGVKRVIGSVVFKLYAGTQEMEDFLIINTPSVGVIQDKPIYSNVKNGIGIFLGRPSVTHVAALAEPSKDSLISGQYTGHLGFARN